MKRIRISTYRYHYTGEVLETLAATKKYHQDNDVCIDDHQVNHFVAGIMLSMMANGYYFSAREKASLVGEDYDWSENIK